MIKKILAIFSAFMLVSVTFFNSVIEVNACTQYRAASQTNICTVSYYTNGTTTITYSLGSNMNPTMYIHEYLHSDLHTGSLSKWLTVENPKITFYYTPPLKNGVTMETSQSWVGHYDGYISTNKI